MKEKQKLESFKIEKRRERRGRDEKATVRVNQHDELIMAPVLFQKIILTSIKHA